MRLIDTHAHINDKAFDDDRAQVVARAAESGVEAIINMGDTMESSECCVRLTEEFPSVYAGVGVHPEEAFPMAKWLRIPVIAEGVETRQQAEFLRTIGCNRVQGYYYSRPVPVEAYEEKLSKGDCGLLEDQLSSQLDPTDVEDLLNPNAQVNLLFNSINGAVGLYETVNGQLSVIRVNDGYFRMFGYDREDFYAVEHNIMFAKCNDCQSCCTWRTWHHNCWPGGRHRKHHNRPGGQQILCLPGAGRPSSAQN